MPDSIRIFIAVKIPASPSLRRLLARLEELGSALKPVAAEKQHVTLKFLGETDINLVPEISRVMQNVAAGHASCALGVAGVGVFPHMHRPSVIWAGLTGAEPLIDIAHELETGLAPLGFAREKRRFSPHLTLARVRKKPPAELATILEEHASTEFATAEIEALELLQSELGPDGPRYSVLATAPLG